MNARLLLPALLVTGLLSTTNANAAPITGVFNIAGTITVSNTAITWKSNVTPFPADQATIGPGATGSFAGLDGTAITIHDLMNATAPVDGTGFPAMPFISFNAAPTLPGLDINFIFQGIFGTAGCANPPAVGQTCTPNPPVTPGISPFNFTNISGTNGPQATASFAFSGVSSDGLSLWNGNFTSQFSVPLQQVLSQLGTVGFVTNTYSATITVTPAPTVPEPGPLALMSIGLALMIVSFQVRRRRRI